MRKLLIAVFTLIAIYFSIDFYFKTRRLTGEKFVAKYKHTNFDVFRNKGYVTRGYNNGNPVIIFSILTSSDSLRCTNFDLATVNLDSNKILSILSIPDYCHELLTAEDSILILKYASFNFKSLSVDLRGNVRIWITENSECPKLIKFSSPSEKTEEYASWKKLDNGWYEENLN